MAIYIDWERGDTIQHLANYHNLAFERVRRIVKREQARLIHGGRSKSKTRLGW